MFNVVVQITREDSDIVEIDEKRLPFIRRKYKVKYAMETSGSVRQPKRHSCALERPKVAY